MQLEAWCSCYIRPQFRILFLDRKNALIADEVQQTGTVDHTPVYPREVVKRALELSATAIVLVHNHPSGDPTPSRADIQMTQAIVEVARALGIAVHDHLIVGKDGHASLRALKLMWGFASWIGGLGVPLRSIRTTELFRSAQPLLPP